MFIDEKMAEALTNSSKTDIFNIEEPRTGVIFLSYSFQPLVLILIKNSRIRI